jgi:hypothetical protein
VLLPISWFRKVTVYFCSDQGAMRCPELVEGMEHSSSYVTEEQRRYEQKDQELVYRNLFGINTSRTSQLLALVYISIKLGASIIPLFQTVHL